MFRILWKFRPAPGREAEFERAYAPQGPWAQLFGRAEGYLGTELLVDDAEPGAFFTLDSWRAREDFERFQSNWRAEYEELDRRLEGLAASEALIGRWTPAGLGR
jgi:heme-degrading monooxygenase HmoA